MVSTTTFLECVIKVSDSMIEGNKRIRCPSCKGPFTNYVYKRRGVGGQKNKLFVNIYTIDNVNRGG